MADNLVHLRMKTKHDIPPERVLNGALKADLESVVVIGYDADGNEYFAGSQGDMAESLWLVERFKHFLLSQQD